VPAGRIQASRHTTKKKPPLNILTSPIARPPSPRHRRRPGACRHLHAHVRC
jgi:hypothetical protein